MSRAGREVRFTDEAILAFERYRWPGNVRELLNVVEQLIWLAPNGVIGIEHLPVSMRTVPQVLKPVDNRRRKVADDLYDAVVRQGASFWEHVYPMFLARDIRRDDLRELVRLGRRESRGRQVDAHAVRHAAQRLSAVHEFSGRSWVRRRRPRVP